MQCTQYNITFLQLLQQHITAHYIILMSDHLFLSRENPPWEEVAEHVAVAGGMSWCVAILPLTLCNTLQDIAP